MSDSWIYLAAPLFSSAEITFNQNLAVRLRTEGYKVYLPQQECEGITEAEELYKRCLYGLDGACMVLVILDGADADSGSCFEVGYAFAKGLPIIGLRTDFRGSGDRLGMNLMLTQSCDRLLITTPNPPISTPSQTYLKIGEDFIPPLLEALKSLM